MTLKVSIAIITLIRKYFQGRVKVPTGGKAHEQQCMIRCDSEADSKVWMKENNLMLHIFGYELWNINYSRVFL